MSITRVRALVIGIVAIAATAVVAGVVYVTLIDDKELRYTTQTALRRALPRTAAAELRSRGITLPTALTCRDIPGWTRQRMRVTCTGVAGDRSPVQVIGTGDDATRDHYFTILVNGRPLVQNAACLGDDCRKRES